MKDFAHHIRFRRHLKKIGRICRINHGNAILLRGDNIEELFKKAPKAPKLIPDKTWIPPTLPSEKNTFSVVPHLDFADMVELEDTIDLGSIGFMP